MAAFFEACVERFADTTFKCQDATALHSELRLGPDGWREFEDMKLRCIVVTIAGRCSSTVYRMTDAVSARELRRLSLRKLYEARCATCLEWIELTDDRDLTLHGCEGTAYLKTRPAVVLEGY